jgi:hypothetical protein
LSICFDNQLACLTFYHAIAKEGEESLNFLKQSAYFFEQILKEDPSFLKIDEISQNGSLEIYGIFQMADLCPSIQSHLMV